MKKNFDFQSVNGSAKDCDVLQAYEGLKLLVRMGKIAEKALRKMDEGQAVVGRFPILNGLEHLAVLEFEEVVKATRDEIPPLSDLTIQYGSETIGYHAGNEFPEVPIIIHGTFLRLDKVTKELSFKKDSGVLGHFRPKSGGTPTIDINGTVFPIYKDFKNYTNKGWDGAFAGIVAGFLCPAEFKNGKFKQRSILGETSSCLIEEGHLERLCVDMRRWQKIFEVMSG